MPITAAVTAGWTYSTGNTATASNLNALGIPTVKINDGETYLVGAGTVGAPGVAINGDANTGIAQLSGADTISLVGGGAEVVRITSTQALCTNGSDAAPGISFMGDADTGINHDAANELDIVVGGKLLGTFSDSLFSLDGKLEADSIYIGSAPVLTAGISPTTAFFFTDFYEGLAVSGFAGTVVGSGSASNGTTAIAGQANGIVRLGLATTSANSAILATTAPMAFGNSVIWRIKTFLGAALSNGTNRYYILIGTSELGTSEELTGGSGNAAWFQYDDATSAQWQCVSRVTGTKETTTTGTTVASTTDLKFEIQRTASTVVFLINGSTVATHSTQVPTAASRCFPIVRITSTLGTPASQVIDVDAFEMQYTIART